MKTAYSRCVYIPVCLPLKLHVDILFINEEIVRDTFFFSVLYSWSFSQITYRKVQHTLKTAKLPTCKSLQCLRVSVSTRDTQTLQDMLSDSPKGKKPPSKPAHKPQLVFRDSASPGWCSGLQWAPNTGWVWAGPGFTVSISHSHTNKPIQAKSWIQFKSSAELPVKPFTLC